MTNFIFKSQWTYKKLCQQLEMLLAEQRNQRHDLKVLQMTVNKVINSLNLQKQVDDYFEEDETSPQTDDENKREEI